MEDRDNVTEFPARDGSSMPPTRGGTTRQQARAQLRAAEKSSKAAETQEKNLRRMLESPVTKREFQKAMFNIFGSLEKVVAEFRKLAVRNEAQQSLLYSKGFITKEEYEEVATKHAQWNHQIDVIINAYETSPLNEVVKAVGDWNAKNDLKIEWQHIDLAPRLLDDQTLTLEEKLAIAADMEMPEPFIDELRRRDTGNAITEAAEEFAAKFTPEEALRLADASKTDLTSFNGLNTPAPN